MSSKNKEKKETYLVMAPAVGIFSGLKEMGFRGKRLWITTGLIIALTMIIATLLAIYFL